MLTGVNDRDLVNASPLIRAAEFKEGIGIERIFGRGNELVLDFNFNLVGVDVRDCAGTFSKDHDPGIASGFELHTGPDERGLSFKERHGLALHIGPHKGAVSVVIFKEGDKGGSDRDDLFRGDVHEVNAIAWDFGSFFVTSGGYALVNEPIVVVEGFIGLSDDQGFFFVGSHIADFIRNKTSS